LFRNRQAPVEFLDDRQMTRFPWLVNRLSTRGLLVQPGRLPVAREH
jgi:hypothetical protein